MSRQDASISRVTVPGDFSAAARHRRHAGCRSELTITTSDSNAPYRLLDVLGTMARVSVFNAAARRADRDLEVHSAR